MLSTLAAIVPDVRPNALGLISQYIMCSTVSPYMPSRLVDPVCMVVMCPMKWNEVYVTPSTLHAKACRLYYKHKHRQNHDPNVTHVLCVARKSTDGMQSLKKSQTKLNMHFASQRRALKGCIIDSVEQSSKRVCKGAFIVSFGGCSPGEM